MTVKGLRTTKFFILNSKRIWHNTDYDGTYINDQVLPIHLQYFSHDVQETMDTMTKYSIWKTALENPWENGFATTDFVPTFLMVYDMHITFSYILNTLYGEAGYL